MLYVASLILTIFFFAGNIAQAVNSDLITSEINHSYNLNDKRYLQDFSYWVNELNKKDSPASTLVIYSDGPLATSLARPRRISSADGKLFLAKVHQKDGAPQVEFISWNRSRRRNDFGVITNFGQPGAKVDLADRIQCLQCHKTSSAIFMKGPWITSTGANATTAALQSLGVLFRLKDTQPAPWAALWDFFQLDNRKRMKSEYGDYPSEVNEKAKAVKLDGISVFDFKGAEQLDENVVRNYLLTLTHEIHRKLSETDRKKFAEELTVGAIKSVAYSKEIEHAWNWYPFLKGYIIKELKKESLLGGVGPLRTNYFPPFQNPEITQKLKITVSSYHPESFEALLEADRLIETSGLDMFPAEVSSRNEKVYEPLVPRFRSDTGRACLTNVFDLNLAEIDQLKFLITRHESKMEEILQSKEWKNIFLSGEIPHDKTWYHWLMAKLGRETTVRVVNPNSAQGHRCLTCHGENGTAKKMPFDPLKVHLWEERLSANLSSEERDALAVWIRKIPDRMTKPKDNHHLMPPLDSNEGTNFDLNRKEFADYKEAVSQFTELQKKLP